MPRLLQLEPVVVGVISDTHGRLPAMEYFADGISDEILNRPVRVPEMEWLPAKDCDGLRLRTFRDDGSGRAKSHCPGRSGGAQR
jgi:hypothetical protein